MNWMRWSLSVALVAVLVGCQECDPDVTSDQQVVDRALLDVIRLQPVEQAIIAQHTVYPYHFVEGQAELNDLGRGDLHVLGRHYRDQDGPVNVWQGQASAELYEARVQQVVQAMQEDGVPADRIHIGQELPGGPGLSSQWVLRIMAKQEPGQERALPQAGMGPGAQ